MRDVVTDPEQTEIALAFSHVRDVRRFYHSLIVYIVVISALIAINLIMTPRVIWVIFPALGWGVALLVRGLQVFDVLPWFGPEWEKRQVEKRLGRKL